MSLSQGQNKSARLVSRRDFFKQLSMGLGAAAIAALDPGRVLHTGGVASASRGSWSQAWFMAHVGDHFTVKYGLTGRLRFKLLKVEQGIIKVSRNRQGQVRTAQGECFLLVFEGPRNPTLPEQIYHLAHPELGRFSLFISPSSATQKRQRYVAVVNTVHA